MSSKLAKIAADFVTQLAATMAAASTTGTLQSVTDDDGNALPNGVYYFTIDGNNSNKEYIQATITGTSMASIKHVTRQGTLSSGTTLQHRAGATVEITDFAIIKMMLNLLDGTDDLDASNPLQYDAAPTLTPGSNELATVKYADEISVAGGANASTSVQGLVEIPTQAEVDAGTSAGGTGAKLAVTPDLIRAKAYHDYVADSVGTDAYAITTTPAISAYATGQVFTFKAGTANTGAATLNVCGLGAKTIKKNYNVDLETGDILANQIVQVIYDGTNMQLLSRIIGFRPVKRQYELADSPATWTKPTGLSFIIVEAWGAGGGGGANNAGGGGGGAYVTKRIAAADLGATETITIGTGGPGGTGTSAGTAGGNTTFGSLLTAYGGGAGGGDNNGSGGGGGGSTGAGASGVTTTAGAGGNPRGGAAGISGAGGDSTQGYGGGGGGDGGTGTATGGHSVMGGGGGAGGGGDASGGSSIYGGGGGGCQTNGAGGSSLYGGAGGTNAAGTVPAGGGAGGAAANGAGKAGAAGRVIVYEF